MWARLAARLEVHVCVCLSLLTVFILILAVPRRLCCSLFIHNWSRTPQPPNAHLWTAAAKPVADAGAGAGAGAVSRHLLRAFDLSFVLI